jgi:hypothetical protein
MIEEIQEPMEVMAEFMSPFEDQLDIVVLGDGITDETHQELETAFNDMRRLINDIPSMKSTPLGNVNMFRYGTQELYRGAASDQLKNYSLIYTDPELSRQLISLLTMNNNEVDDLDAMLLDKYILQQPQEKYILDITSTPDDMIDSLMKLMDRRPAEFNYIIYGQLMGIWIYWVDDFTLIQNI